MPGSKTTPTTVIPAITPILQDINTWLCQQRQVEDTLRRTTLSPYQRILIDRLRTTRLSVRSLLIEAFPDTP